MTNLRDTASRAFATSVDREITKVPDGTGCSYVAPNTERRYLIDLTLTARYKTHSRSQPVRGFFVRGRAWSWALLALRALGERNAEGVRPSAFHRSGAP